MRDVPESATQGPVHDHGGRRWRWFWPLLFALTLAYLATEHRTHLSGAFAWLPYLLLAACPLMHFFGHGRHRGGAG
jgi:hypothetical protein